MGLSLLSLVLPSLAQWSVADTTAEGLAFVALRELLSPLVVGHMAEVVCSLGHRRCHHCVEQPLPLVAIGAAGLVVVLWHRSALFSHTGNLFAGLQHAFGLFCTVLMAKRRKKN